MTKRLTEKEVNDFIIGENCFWVSGNYKNNQSKLKIRFECGCIGEIVFMNFGAGTRCREHSREKAAIKRRKSISDMIEYISKYGFINIEVVSGLGYGRKTDFLYECSKGHTTKRCFKDFYNHPTCGTCETEKLKEKYRLKEEDIKDKVEDHGCNLIEIISYSNTRDSLLKTDFSCGHSENISFSSFIARKTGLCVECEMESRSGETAYGWKGGVTPITNYIRKSIKQWNSECAKKYEYKCVVTGNPMDHIHHLQSFNLILSEALDNLKLKKLKSVEDYSKEELDVILNEFLFVQSQYPIGVPLINSVHILFHKIYGRGNNTPEQFYEFVDKIESGEIIINKQ